jgi:hypothetical protein
MARRNEPEAHLLGSGGGDDNDDDDGRDICTLKGDEQIISNFDRTAQ